MKCDMLKADVFPVQRKVAWVGSKISAGRGGHHNRDILLGPRSEWSAENKLPTPSAWPYKESSIWTINIDPHFHEEVMIRHFLTDTNQALWEGGLAIGLHRLRLVGSCRVLVSNVKQRPLFVLRLGTSFCVVLRRAGVRSIVIHQRFGQPRKNSLIQFGRVQW